VFSQSILTVDVAYPGIQYDAHINEASLLIISWHWSASANSTHHKKNLSAFSASAGSASSSGYIFGFRSLSNNDAKKVSWIVWING
jgi:hypothetical protein